MFKNSFLRQFFESANFFVSIVIIYDSYSAKNNKINILIFVEKTNLMKQFSQGYFKASFLC